MAATGTFELLGNLIGAAAAAGGTYEAGKALTAGRGGYVAGKFGNHPTNVPAPPSMPSIQETDQAAQLQESKDAAARYGRNATILTNNQGTGDKLGP